MVSQRSKQASRWMYESSILGSCTSAFFLICFLFTQVFHMYVYVSLCELTCVFMTAYVGASNTCAHVCIFIYTYMHVYVCLSLCACDCVYVCLSVSACVYICIYA